MSLTQNSRLCTNPVDPEKIVEEGAGQGKQDAHGDPSYGRPGVPFGCQGVEAGSDGQKAVDQKGYGDFEQHGKP